MSIAQQTLSSFLNDHQFNDFYDAQSSADDMFQTLFHCLVNLLPDGTSSTPVYHRPCFDLHWQAPHRSYLYSFFSELPCIEHSISSEHIIYHPQASLESRIQLWQLSDGSYWVGTLNHPLSFIRTLERELPGLKSLSFRFPWAHDQGHEIHWFSLASHEIQDFFKEWMSHITLSGLSGFSWLPHLQFLTFQHQNSSVFTQSFAPQDVYSFMDKILMDLRQQQLDEWLEFHKSVPLAGDSPIVHWREALLSFIYQSPSLPHYDCGLASLFIQKPSLYFDLSLDQWKQLAFDFNHLLSQKRDQLDIEAIEHIIPYSKSNPQLSSSLAPFLYRYYRPQGAHQIAKEIVSSLEAYWVAEAKKTGLAAKLKTKLPTETFFSQHQSHFASADFLTQYSTACALSTALLALEDGFSQLPLYTKIFIQSLPSFDAITVESFGWFSRLIFDLGEGFISSETIISTLETQLKEHLEADQAQKKHLRKSTIENEWSGTWGVQLAVTKAKDYLQLHQIHAMKSIQE